MRWKEINENDGDAYFDPKELEMSRNQSHNSRDRLIYMSPDDFLSVAMSGHDASKEERVGALMKLGTKFSSIPFLGFTHDGEGTAVVTGHEGRHRARALKAAGITRMPVLLSHRYDANGQSMRWNSVDSDGMDGFRDEWPNTLYGERGDDPETSLHRHNKIPFPVPDLRRRKTVETASCGGTSSASIATSVGGLGAGFDPNGDKGIYQTAKKKKKAPILRR